MKLISCKWPVKVTPLCEKDCLKRKYVVETELALSGLGFRDRARGKRTSKFA